MKEEKTKIINVKCTLVISVEVPDNEEYDEFFDIEENHCPATGRVGSTLDKHIEDYDKKGFCWACALKGKCEIVD